MTKKLLSSSKFSSSSSSNYAVGSLRRSSMSDSTISLISSYKRRRVAIISLQNKLGPQPPSKNSLKAVPIVAMVFYYSLTQPQKLSWASILACELPLRHHLAEDPTKRMEIRGQSPFQLEPDSTHHLPLPLVGRTWSQR